MLLRLCVLVGLTATSGSGCRLLCFRRAVGARVLVLVTMVLGKLLGTLRRRTVTRSIVCGVEGLFSWLRTWVRGRLTCVCELTRLVLISLLLRVFRAVLLWICYLCFLFPLTGMTCLFLALPWKTLMMWREMALTCCTSWVRHRRLLFLIGTKCISRCLFGVMVGLVPSGENRTCGTGVAFRYLSGWVNRLFRVLGVTTLIIAMGGSPLVL